MGAMGSAMPEKPEVTISNAISGGVFHGLVIQAQTVHSSVQSNPLRHAEGVTAWTGPHVALCLARGEAWGEVEGSHHFHTFVVHNAGRQPIHDVAVNIPAPDADLLPGEEPLMIVAVGLVPPHERREVTIGDCGQFEPQFAVPLDVSFTTADGTQWHREASGQLSRATDPAV